MNNRYVQLSKFLSFILRHDPYRFELEVDDQGYVSLPKLMQILNEQDHFADVTEEEIEALINDGDKKRFEIKDSKIRALYGHSFPNKVEYESVEPPEFLYQATAPRNIRFIRDKGMHPVDRQYIHLSADKEVAMNVGKRRSAHPAILTIRSSEAYAEGVKFFNPEEGIFLAKSIPSRFIEFPKIDYSRRPQRNYNGRNKFNKPKYANKGNPRNNYSKNDDGASNKPLSYRDNY